MTEQFDKQDVRQARRGTNLPAILVCSLLLMLVAWFVFELIWV